MLTDLKFSDKTENLTENVQRREDTWYFEWARDKLHEFLKSEDRINGGLKFSRQNNSNEAIFEWSQDQAKLCFSLLSFLFMYYRSYCN